MYFLIFHPEDMLKLYLDFNESQPIYTYKRYAHIKKKDCTSIAPKSFPDELKFADFVKLCFVKPLTNRCKCLYNYRVVEFR